jgi:CDP-glucose 4,6-dehydratase
MESMAGLKRNKSSLKSVRVLSASAKQRRLRALSVHILRGRSAKRTPPREDSYIHTILVTGGTGFVGAHLVEALARKGNRVVVTQRATDPASYFFQQKLDKKVVLASLDLNDFDRVLNIITRYEIDTICHLGAQAIVTTAYVNPREAIETNVMGTANILEAARLCPNVKRIIVASSDKAYGKLPEYGSCLSRIPRFSSIRSRNEGFSAHSLHTRSEVKNETQDALARVTRTRSLEYLETDPLAGDHPYEVSKSAADLIAQMYVKTYHLPVVITRFGNIYGPGDMNFNRIIPGIMHSIISKEKLFIRSDGTFVRDYVYVGDVVSGYQFILDHFEKMNGQAYNLSSDDSVSVVNLIKKSQKILRKKIRFEIQNTQVNEIPYQHLSYDKIKKFGWKPKFTLRKGLTLTYKWYKHNKQ